jgi:hypothetical protein
MKEDQEKSFGRKVFDAAGFGFSLVTLPFGLYTAGTSLAAGELTRFLIAAGFSAHDLIQIRDYGKPREQQSSLNIGNKIGDFLFPPKKGSQRFAANPA